MGPRGACRWLSFCERISDLCTVNRGIADCSRTCLAHIQASPLESLMAAPTGSFLAGQTSRVLWVPAGKRGAGWSGTTVAQTSRALGFQPANGEHGGLAALSPRRAEFWGFQPENGDHGGLAALSPRLAEFWGSSRQTGSMVVWQHCTVKKSIFLRVTVTSNTWYH